MIVMQGYFDTTRNSIVAENDPQGLIERGIRCRLQVSAEVAVSPVGGESVTSVLREQTTRLIVVKRRDCKSNDVTRFGMILEHGKVQKRFCGEAPNKNPKKDGRSGRVCARSDSWKGGSNDQAPEVIFNQVEFLYGRFKQEAVRG
ncbi:unnamed protein product [Phytophthora fragariaefolia]|uniref:Unnamed protein product n=1 Tax=Phytophthora fragariaefolia TaxID=1490495 RepID=A0A9W6UBG3_9STRA|nr:unnamed protein product [Phytophthora fragariaefolia]